MDPPREHHQRFKYSLMRRALEEPAKFRDACTCERPVDVLDTVWRMLAADLPDDERLSSDGLAVEVREDGVIVVRMPRAERPNEAYFVAAVPHGSAYRLFALEKSEDVAFVVELDATSRMNYGPAADASVESLFEAIDEIVSGDRAPASTTQVRLA